MHGIKLVIIWSPLNSSNSGKCKSITFLLLEVIGSQDRNFRELRQKKGNPKGRGVSHFGILKAWGGSGHFGISSTSDCMGMDIF